MMSYRRQIQKLILALVGALLLVSGIGSGSYLDPNGLSVAEAQTPSEETLSGVFSTMWVDPAPGSNIEPRVEYILTDDRGKKTELQLDEEVAKPAGGALALNGKRVTVEGRGTRGDRIDVKRIEPEQGARTATAQRTVTGAKATVTILCRFSDLPTVTPHDRSWFETLMGSAYPGMDHYWRELSYGKIYLSGSSVVGWYNLPHSRSYYMSGSKMKSDLLLKDCTAAADANVFFPDYTNINLMFNGDPPERTALGASGYSLTRDGETKTYGVTWMPKFSYEPASRDGQPLGTGQVWLAHEMGHTFGLNHSSGPYSDEYDSDWDPMSDGSICSPRHSTYGCIGVYTNTYHMDELLGWVPATRKYTATPPTYQNITLERIANPGANSNYLMAKIPIRGSSTRFYVVEARRREGYDNQIPGEGVVIHKVDTTLDDRNAQVVDPDNDGDPNDAGAIWLPDETFTDSANGIWVEVTGATASGYNVTIISREQFPFIWKRGSQGSGNEQFFRPYGMDTDSSGNIYVADTQNNRVQKLASNGDFIDRWGSQGSGNGQFQLPYDVATDSSGNVYVTDFTGRIQKFTSGGDYIATLGGGYGTGNGQFASPQGIAIDSSGNIYVADTQLNRIQKLGSNGNFIDKWGSFGSGNKQFDRPTGIDTDSSGNVYVADTGNERIQKLTSSGEYVDQWGGQGTGDGKFLQDSPSGVAADSSGNVYAIDNNNNRIQKFTSSGEFLTKWGSSGSLNGEFDRPDGIATDSSGNVVYVAEFGNNRIQKFGNETTAREAPTNDNFTNAQTLSGASVTVTGSNQDATKETGEPAHAGNPGGKSVWYEWTPQTNETAIIDTAGSDFDTLLAVYTGDAVDGLSEVASDDDNPNGGLQSKVSFPVTAGTVYWMAVDGYNNDAESASGTITLNLETTSDTTPPDPPVIDSPSDNSFDNDGDFTVSGTAEADSTIELFDDTTSEDTTQADANGDWAIELSGIAEGEHTYTAKATDDAGNTSAASNTVAVTVDTAEPDAKIDSGPSGTTSSGSARFAFSSSESGVTFQCSLDEAAFEDCSSPRDYSGLDNRQHTFRVKATDRAGNTSPEASRTWTVNVPPPDTTAPTGSVKINNGAKATKSLKVTLALSATDSGGSGVAQMCVSNTTSCMDWQTYATSKSWKLSGKSAGTKTVYVSYKDEAGNVSAVFKDTIKYAP